MTKYDQSTKDVSLQTSIIYLDEMENSREYEQSFYARYKAKLTY